MVGLEVGLGDIEVVAHGLHVGVAKNHLEGEGIAAVFEVLDGEGVAEAMRVDILDACTRGDGIDDF